MELTNEQIEKVNIMYLGAKYKCTTPIIDCHTYEGIVDLYVLHKMSDNLSPQAYGFKLILRTIEQLADNEKIVLNKIYFGDDINDPAGGEIVLESYYKRKKKYHNILPFEAVSIDQFLISIGVAVPLFIAPDHPANGMHAIALGLAIPATL